MTVSRGEGNFHAKPAMVLIPGAWFSQFNYTNFLEIIREPGYATADGSYPSLNSKDPAATDAAADIAFVRSNTLPPLMKTEGNDVVIVMHSYGGVPSSAAASGLSEPT